MTKKERFVSQGVKGEVVAKAAARLRSWLLDPLRALHRVNRAQRERVMSRGKDLALVRDVLTLLRAVGCSTLAVERLWGEGGAWVEDREE